MAKALFKLLFKLIDGVTNVALHLLLMISGACTFFCSIILVLATWSYLNNDSSVDFNRITCLFYLNAGLLLTFLCTRFFIDSYKKEYVNFHWTKPNK
jgi:hypothetical protein